MKMRGTNIIEILLIWLSNAGILRGGLIMLKHHKEEFKYIEIWLWFKGGLKEIWKWL